MTTYPSDVGRPRFELRQVLADGTETVEVCSLAGLAQRAHDVHLARRGFVGLSALSVSAALLVACCCPDLGRRQFESALRQGTLQPELATATRTPTRRPSATEAPRAATRQPVATEAPRSATTQPQATAVPAAMADECT